MIDALASNWRLHINTVCFVIFCKIALFANRFAWWNRGSAFRINDFRKVEKHDQIWFQRATKCDSICIFEATQHKLGDAISRNQWQNCTTRTINTANVQHQQNLIMHDFLNCIKYGTTTWQNENYEQKKKECTNVAMDSSSKQPQTSIETVNENELNRYVVGNNVLHTQ